MIACLDSWALIAWLDDHPRSADMVHEVMESRPLMSWINMAEVYYRIDREKGEKTAVAVTNKMRMALDLELPTERRILETARLKSVHPIALGDCFAISTAADNDAVLYTGDPEILAIKNLPCDVRDLRG